MSLIEYDLFGQKRDKVQTAIDRLRAFEPKDGYLLFRVEKTASASIIWQRWQA